jgi:hypothetical protein
MSFFPAPPVAEYHASASSAAGFLRTSRDRVASSIRRAPSSIPITSSPWSAAGTSPTTDSSLVLPPTQSHIGKRATKPASRAYRSSSLPSPVTATACFPNDRPRRL